MVVIILKMIKRITIIFTLIFFEIFYFIIYNHTTVLHFHEKHTSLRNFHLQHFLRFKFPFIVQKVVQILNVLFFK